MSHVDDPLAVVQEAARVVKRGGLVGFFDGDYASLTFSHPDPAQGKIYDEAIQQAVVTNPRVMRQKWFRRGRNWRAGIEGRISGLKRRHGLERCRNHGEDGMDRWVGWGVLAHDVRTIAQHRADRAARQARPTVQKADQVVTEQA
jgi:hypothetical protein